MTAELALTLAVFATPLAAPLIGLARRHPTLREAVTLIGGWHGSRYANLLARISRERARLQRLRLPRLG